MKKIFIIFALLMFTFSNAFAAGEVNNVLYTGQNLFGIEKSDRAQIKE